MASKKPSGLGRGLGALLGDDVMKTEAQGALTLPITDVESNSSQPRKYFDDAALAELADSIRQGHIAYIINTSNIGSTDQIHDGHEIRKLATENNVTLFTSLDTVKVLLDVLDEITLRISTIDA